MTSEASPGRGRRCSGTTAGCVAAGILALASGGLGTNAAADGSLTVVSWGGPYERSQVKAYFEPFTAKTGIRIDVERYNGGLVELRRQAAEGSVGWDLVDMTMADNRAACKQGLLEPMDHTLLPPAADGTPAERDFIDGALTGCGTAQIVYAMVIAYYLCTVVLTGSGSMGMVAPNSDGVSRLALTGQIQSIKTTVQRY